MAYSDVVLADTPIIYWPLQEASGVATVVDLSGNGRNGTVAGSLTQVAGPITGEFSQLLDATTEYITHGTAFPTSQFQYTVEAWVYVPTGTFTATAIAGLSTAFNGSPDGNIILNADASLNFYHRMHGEVSFNSGPLARGYWHHVAASVGAVAGGTRMYVNGVQTNFWNTSQFLGGYSNEMPFVHTGNWNGGAPMRVAHVAFYQVSLSSAQILSHFQGMGTLDNPANNTTTQAQVWTQSVEIAVQNFPRAQVWTQSVDVALRSIPRAQVWTQSVDVAIKEIPAGGSSLAASAITVTASPGLAGNFQPADMRGPTSTVTTTALSGVLGRILFGPRALMMSTAGAGEVTATVIDRTYALTLTLLQATIQGLPNVLGVNVTGGTADAVVYFFLGASNDPVVSVTLDAQGTATNVSIPLTSSLGAGAVSVKVSEDVAGGSPSATQVVTIESTTVIDVDPAPYVPVRDTDVTQWQFRDYVDPSIVYVFPINPDSMETPISDAPIVDMHTTSPSGRRILFEGAANAPSWSFSGRTLTEEHAKAMQAWAKKSQRIYLTDHMNRRMVVKVEGFSMTAVRDRERPWHYRYDMRVRILSVEESLL